MIAAPELRAHRGFAAAAGTAGLIAAALVVWQPLVAALGALAIVSVVVAQRTRAGVEGAAALALIGGACVLGFGFANLGVRTGGVPIPLTEVLLLPLAVVAIADPRTRPPARVLVPGLLFIAVVAARLVLDLPRHGTDAIRDATLAVELLAIAVGYRAVMREGLDVWLRRLAVVFLAVLAYGSLFPVRLTLKGIGPTVGLQRDVSLLGEMAGVAFAVAAAALFFLTFAGGARRVLLVAWALGVAALMQQRSLYLLIPASLFVLGWLHRRRLRILLVVAAALVVGVVALSFAGALGVEGRRGPVSPTFIAEHARTLTGEGGPGAGSIRDRTRWAERTLEEVGRSPGSIAFGVGLGPDLTFGFRRAGEVAVRKPHNDYLEVLARTGAVGFALFAWFLVAAIAPSLRAARARGGTAARACGWVVATAVVYLGVAAVQPLLSFPYGTVPLFFVLGMGLAAARRAREEVRR